MADGHTGRRAGMARVGEIPALFKMQIKVESTKVDII